MYDIGMDTQAKLITTTQDLLWERGYVGTSPKAIQMRAGVGQGSMYHHFDGKTDLCAAAVRRSGETLQAEVEPIFSGPGTALERISVYLRRKRDVLRGCRIGGLTQDPEIIAQAELRAPVAETLVWLQNRIAAVLTEGQKKGELREDFSARRIARTICAVLQGAYVLARGENSPRVFTDAIEGAISLLESLVAEPQ